MSGSDGVFRIAQISDLHCGGPYFEVSLLERAIGEINELKPDVVVCSGDLTTFGFRHEYLTAREYIDRIDCDSIVVVPGNHDSRNVGYVHFEEMFGERNSVLRKGGVAIVAVDSSEPDLDHGQIGRGRYRWVEEQFAEEPSDLKIFVLHHHLLPVPGTGRERNVVYDAGDAIECLQRAGVRLVLSGHKHVPYVWRLEDLFVVNAGTVSSLRLRGQHETVLQRHRDRRRQGRHLAAPPVSRRAQARLLHPRHARVRQVHRRDRGRGHRKDVRALAIVDGEHYAPVVRDALAGLPYDVVAAVLVGGTEKLRGGEDYGVPLAEDVEAAIARFSPEIVLDLSDEPVLGPVERLALASRVLALGLPYAGADFRFDPPALEPFPLPSLAVIGTGKRVGKTAVTGHLARLLARDRRVVVVAMGRGGPPEPETIAVPPTVDALVALSRAGRHAASDHLETAALVGVETVGARRCGGGLAGAVFSSNVAEAARVARALEPDLVVFDGSGAALPPVAAGRTIMVVGGHQPPEVAAGYLNAFRLLRADLVVVTMAEEGTGWERTRDAVRQVAPDGRRTSSRPSCARGPRRTFAAAPSRTSARRHPRRTPRSPSISRRSTGPTGRARLREPGRPPSASRASSRDLDVDVCLVELKAAAVDVVAEHALARGAEVVLAANEVVPVGEKLDLDGKLLQMARIQL